MDRAKRQFELVPAEALVDIQQYSSPVVATSAIRLAARLKLADRMAPPVNVIISNVPGPRQPLYLDGAEMRTYIPVSTIAEGMGLNVTVHSYLDELEFGLIACRELVPDLWHMVDLHLDEIDVLFAAAGVPRDDGAVAATAAPGAGEAGHPEGDRQASAEEDRRRETATRSAPTTEGDRQEGHDQEGRREEGRRQEGAAEDGASRRRPKAPAKRAPAKRAAATRRRPSGPRQRVLTVRPIRSRRARAGIVR